MTPSANTSIYSEPGLLVSACEVPETSISSYHIYNFNGTSPSTGATHTNILNVATHNTIPVQTARK